MNGTVPRARVYIIRRNTKGKRQGHSLILHPRAAAAVVKWLSVRRSFKQDDWLFQSQQGSHSPLGRRSAWEILHRALLQAGVTGMAGTHVLRKTYCQNVHRALNGDLFRLAVAMRHTSPLTTLAYLSFRQEEIDRAILRA
jgi:integrase